MSQFQKELQQIKPSDRLVMETMRRMHEENAKRKEEAGEESDSPSGAACAATEPVEAAEKAAVQTKAARDASRRKRFFTGFLSAAAGLMLLCAAVLMRSAANVSMVTLQADAAPALVSAAERGLAGAEETALSAEEFGRRAGMDPAALVPGYDLTNAEAVAFTDADGEILGDYGVFSYQRGVRRIVLYASTSDQTAPAELMTEDAETVSGREVRFGRTVDKTTYYAAWIQDGTAMCVKSDGLGRRAFIDLIKRIVV